MCIGSGRSEPFLRWPGGKRWLVPILERYALRSHYRRYLEPFLGGGALFFALPPQHAILSDINPELINAYRQVKSDPLSVIAGLKALAIDSKTFEKQRLLPRRDPLARAIRFLYLNRTCFSGLYRVNKEGVFNVPYAKGTRNTDVLTCTDILATASRKLRNTTILNCDFQRVLSEAGRGDLVFCDPTYTVKHNNNGFRRYNELLFSWEDQERLSRSCLRAAEKGAAILVSNAYHHEIKSLFRGFKSRVVYRRSLLSATSAFRGVAREYLFYT